MGTVGRRSHIEAHYSQQQVVCFNMAYFHRREKAPVTFPGLQPANHWLLDIEVPITGSTGKQYYVTLKNKGFTCTCTGFTMHGKCKHITGFWDKLGQEPTRYRGG